MATPEVAIAEEREASGRRNPWNSKYVFPVLIFFIITGFYWKLTLTRQYDWVWGPDLAEQVLPWFEEEARQLQHHELPFWDPHAWLGQSMIGQAQPGVAYPLNWILFLIPRFSGHIPMLALQWYYIVIHYMAALFCYLLCRDLGRSRAASLFGGLVFSLSSYVGTIDWPQMVNGAVWAPLVLLFQLRAARGRRPLVSAALCGTFLGMAWLAGHHQVPIYLTLMMSGVWLYYILRGGRIDWNVAKLAAVAFVFVLLVGSFQILPAEEYGHLAKRWAGADHELTWNEAVPYYVHQEFSLYALSLFAIFIPGMNRHADPFIGLVALAMALAAVALCWKKHAVKLFAAIAIGGLVYSLGFNSVFQGFLYAALPIVNKARVPSMAVIIWGFGAAVLAAFGADYFLPARDSPWTRRLAAGSLWVGLALFALVLGVTFGRNGFDRDDRVMVVALVALLLAGLLHGWRTGNLTGKTAFTLLIMLALLELGNDSGYAFPHRSNKEQRSYIDKIWTNKDIADYLHQQPGVFRVEQVTEVLSPNWNEYWNLDGVKSNTASVTINVMETEWHTWQTRLLYGVSFTVSEKPPLDDSREVFTGASGLHLYQNPGAFPRAWAVHELFPIKDAVAGRSFINDHLGDLRGKALTFENVTTGSNGTLWESASPAEKKIPLKVCYTADDVSIKTHLAERVVMEANMGCDGLLVLSDAYFPGWKAEVDGKPAPIHEVDIALRGVLVPQGRHEIVMRYRPKQVYLGFALTLLGWLGAGALVLFGPKDGEEKES